VWYTPGLNLTPAIQDGKIHMRAQMTWQKLGVDFVKENGVWKIWHMLVAFDYSAPVPDTMLEPITSKLGELKATEPLRPATRTGRPTGIPLNEKPQFVYPRYSPQRPGIVFPNLPKPYYTFAETFSNCNCKQDIPRALLP
jgi:hypothetical protein